MDRRGTAMWTLAVDAVTAEVVTAFEEAGIETLLLKGPSISGWLYEEPSMRGYGDSDLLVDPDRLAEARAKLGELRFRPGFGPLPHPGMESLPAQPWRRDGFEVDLHEKLPGASAEPGRAWALLRAGAAQQAVGGRTVLALGESARLVHVALHAAHHGPGTVNPIEDLRRALELVDNDAWERAAEVARGLDALGPFASGLALLPEGRRLLARLGLEDEARRARPPDLPVVAAGLVRLGAASGSRAKASLLRHELLPSADFMRWWTPLARRSRRGLVVAYPWRWLYLVWHGARVWRDAKHQHISERVDVS